MGSVEFEGDSVEAAVTAALEQLGLERDAVAVDVLEEPSRGFLGIGARPARVRVQPLETAPAATADSVDRSARCREVLGDLLGFMSVTAAIDARDDADHVELEIRLGDEDDEEIGGWLIGRKGQTLDALEHLVARIMAREVGEAVYVTIDAQGYRARRAATLTEMAQRAADQVRRTGRAVPLAPMSSRERRIVHLALQDTPGIRTHSTGEGADRRLVVAPGGRRR